jgi:hypothetical protein
VWLKNVQMMIYVPSVGYRLFVGYKNKVRFNNQGKASGGARWGMFSC